jgi:hypothetical protein
MTPFREPLAFFPNYGLCIREAWEIRVLLEGNLLSSSPLVLRIVSLGWRYDLSSKCEALSSNPSTTKRKER